MALVTVTGTIKDVNGGFPSVGQIKFSLSQDMLSAAGVIVSQAPDLEPVNIVDGTFSVLLESTTNATPSGRYYEATFIGVMEDVYREELIGRFVVTPTPSTQVLADIIDMSASNTSVINFDSSGFTFLQSGTGATERTMQSKMRDFVHIKDFGADNIGDGVTDARPALALALAAHDSIHITQGTYLLGTDITVGSDKTLIFEEGAILAPVTGKVLKIDGDIQAGTSQIFGGAGTVNLADNIRTKTYWVEWWGATGDVLGDDTATLQAAFNALPNGATMRFASPRNYYTTAEVVLDHKVQVHLLGNDGGIGYANPYSKPQITYRGHDIGVAQSTLKMNNCYACTVEGLTIESNDALDFTKGSLRGIWVTYVAGGSPSLSSRDKIINCTIQAYNTQPSWIGIDVQDPSGANNEHHVIEENLIVGGENTYVAGSQTGIRFFSGQVKGCVIERNNISNLGIGCSIAGTFRARDNVFNQIDIVWYFVYLLENSYAFGDDIETVHHYIYTDQHPGGGTMTFMTNRAAGISSLGDNADDYWIKTQGKFTFIDNFWNADAIYNIRAPGPYTFQGGNNSDVYFQGNTINGNQRTILEQPLGLETMNATVVDGERVFHFGGFIYDAGTRNLDAPPTDYIARKTINVSGGSDQTGLGSLYVGDNDISINGLYQEYGLTVTIVGVTGSTEYRFAVVGVDSLGRRAFTSLGHGPHNNTTYVAVYNGNATLSGSNYMHLEWASQPGRPPATWSIYEVNPANAFEWRPIVTGQANVAGQIFQTKDITANPSGSFVARPFYNETSEVGVPGKFLQPKSLVFTDADTTPSVAIGNRFIVSNTAATNVTTFDDGAEGQIIYLQFTTGNTTLKQGTNLKNRGGADVTPATATLKSYQRFSSVWYEQF